jgi:hypothetical protein
MVWFGLVFRFLRPMLLDSYPVSFQRHQLFVCQGHASFPFSCALSYKSLSYAIFRAISIRMSFCISMTVLVMFKNSSYSLVSIVVNSRKEKEQHLPANFIQAETCSYKSFSDGLSSTSSTFSISCCYGYHHNCPSRKSPWQYGILPTTSFPTYDNIVFCLLSWVSL